MKPRRFKPKIKTKKKSYPIHDSVFYKLSNKKRLAKILCISNPEIRSLAADTNYRCFTRVINGKVRDIQEPHLQLDKVHTRIASLLCRVKVPDSLQSGLKGKSNITNAVAHIGNGKRIVTVDIKSFFKSTKRNLVFDFFYNSLKCSPDIADHISKLVTFRDHIPTGSRLSMPMAYFSNKKMFDEIEVFANSRGATMTVYVDDLTFSGASLTREFINCLKKITARYGHILHPEKIRFYGAQDIKLVTGTAISGNKLMPRNSHLKELNHDILKWLSDAGAEKIESKVLGRLNYLGSIDSRFKDKARSIRSSVRKKSAASLKLF